LPKSDHNRAFSRDKAGVDSLRKLISALSHDLRTPLTVIKGDIEVSMLRPRTAAEYQVVLNSNLEEVDRMSRLLDELVILIRAEIGDLQPVFKQIELADLITGLFAEHREKAEAGGVKLKLQSEGRGLVWADPMLMRRLFDKLLENAIQYSPDGGEIIISLAISRETATILIKDPGIGIPRQEQDRVFEPFFRGEKARELVQKGYGLGLAVCKKIVFVHNGKIGIEDPAGPQKGSTLKVELPVRGKKAAQTK
jgi:two-component system, OmpR family, sensor kinase